MSLCVYRYVYIVHIHRSDEGTECPVIVIHIPSLFLPLYCMWLSGDTIPFIHLLLMNTGAIPSIPHMSPDVRNIKYIFNCSDLGTAQLYAT